jgi:PAS domain S-box-containing protein
MKLPLEDHGHARLVALIHSSTDAIISETPEGIITDWNPGAERLYGYRAEEVVGQHLRILAPPERQAEVDATDPALPA